MTEDEEFTPGEMSLGAQWSIVASFFLVGGVIGAFLNSTDPAGGFLGFGFFLAAIAWVVATESGHRFMDRLAESGEQQQQLSDTRASEPTAVCQECGWQNPASNNYCHDCGSELAEGQ